MKSRIILFFTIFTFGLVLSTVTNSVYGGDLIVINKSPEGTVTYFDWDDVKVLPGKVLIWTTTFWSKSDVNKRDIMNGLKLRNKYHECKDMSVTRVMNEIICKDNKNRIVSMFHFDKNGNDLCNEINMETEFIENIPGSVADKMYKTYCK